MSFHILVVSEDDTDVRHPGCPLILHYDSLGSERFQSYDCAVETMIQQVGIQEALGLTDSEWPLNPGEYEIEFWSEEHYIYGVGTEYEAGLAFVSPPA